MKRTIILIIGLVFAGLVGNIVYTMITTKSHSPETVARYSKNNTTITVKYCQPYKKGRLLFGNPGSEALEFYGLPWRTGANEATEISTTQDLKFDNHILKAGNYSLYSIPNEKEWTIIFNTKTGYWGKSFFGSPFDTTKDVFRVTAPRLKNDENVEQFTINFVETENTLALQLLWGEVKVDVPFDIL